MKNLVYGEEEILTVRKKLPEGADTLALMERLVSFEFGYSFYRSF